MQVIKYLLPLKTIDYVEFDKLGLSCFVLNPTIFVELITQAHDEFRPSPCYTLCERESAD